MSESKIALNNAILKARKAENDGPFRPFAVFLIDNKRAINDGKRSVMATYNTLGWLSANACVMTIIIGRDGGIYLFSLIIMILLYHEF
jgi:hypothetical protein